MKASLESLGRSLAARAFARGVELRALAYDLGAMPVARAEGACVICVGNLRAGGSGKTPFASWIANGIAATGVSTAIVLRGYLGSESARGAVVSRGHGPLVSVREAGDEAYLAALKAREGVLVVIGADRVAAAQRAVREGARAVVLDDGFQHRRLHRDCDIALVCPEDLSPSTPLLPAGPLRERAKALSRAHLIAGFEEEWRGDAGAPEILLEAIPSGLVDAGGAFAPLSAPGQKAFAFAGIARPERFLRTARVAGFEIAGARLFPDHHRYGESDFTALEREASASGAQLLLTTEKDLVKIAPDRIFPAPRALRIELRLVSGAPALAEKLRDIGLDPAFVHA